VDRKHRRRTQISGLILLLAGALWSAPAVRPGHGGSVYEKEFRKSIDALDSIKTAIDARRKKLRDLESAEGNFLARLDYLETNIAASKKYLALISSRIDTAETTIVRLTDSLHAAQALLVDRQTIMKQRLRRAYMTGAASPLMVLLMSRSPLDAVHRVRYLDEVHRYDQSLVGKIEGTRKNIDGKKHSFERERATLAQLLTDKKKENAMLLSEEASRRIILSDIRSKKKSNMAMIAELETAQTELNNIIKLLEKKRKKTEAPGVSRPGPRGPFEQQKGALPWPLDGPVVAPFGKIVHPLYKTVTMNNGIDIGASADEAVRCIAAGTVIHTGSMRGLGKLVIVDHGKNFLTIYAHLEEISVTANQSVAAGTVVGKAGAGGISEIPQLHFEIRKSTDALDPDLWLEKRR
jgi:septal ring factor EnvC (AmiA/AmiB activator)